MSERIASFWCRVAHTKAMWPMHGKYICPQCLREYPVFWQDSNRPASLTAGKPASEYPGTPAVTVTH
jgi:hypothetical protein